MQILYGVLIALTVVLIFVKFYFIYENSNYALRIQNKVSTLFSCLIVLLLAGLSIVGCITTFNNTQIYFLIIYIAFYFFLKEIYAKIIIERHNTVYKITMQKAFESEFSFNDLFILKDCKEEKDNLKTYLQSFYKMNKSIRRKNWINTYYKQGKIDILFNEKRYYFELNNLEWVDSIEYIKLQLEYLANIINSIEDLTNIKLKVINNKDIAEKLKYDFIPYNIKQESFKKPALYGERFFNMTMASGYVFGSVLINLILSWGSLSIGIIVLNIIVGVIASLLFVVGQILIISFYILIIRNKDL